MERGSGDAEQGEQARARGVAAPDRERVLGRARLGDEQAIEQLIEAFWDDPLTPLLLNRYARMPWAVNALRQVDTSEAAQVVRLAEALPKVLSDDPELRAQAVRELRPLGKLAVEGLVGPLRAYTAEQSLGAGEDMDWNEIVEDAARLSGIVKTIVETLEAIGGPEAERALAEYAAPRE